MRKGRKPTDRLFYEAMGGFFGEAEVAQVESNPEVRHYISLIHEHSSMRGHAQLEQNCRDEAAEALEELFGYLPEHGQALIMHIEERIKERSRHGEA